MYENSTAAGPQRRRLDSAESYGRGCDRKKRQSDRRRVASAMRDLHAEHEALNNCRESCRGATLYVTLEPCCHEGRQPPCTDAILQSGIREVVIGCPDPNPQVSGNGIRILREHGITVRTGVLEQECLAPNQAFFHWIRTGLPFIALKYAMTLDGKRR